MELLAYNKETDLGLYEDSYDLFGNPYVIKKGNHLIYTSDERSDAYQMYNKLIHKVLSKM